MIIGVGFLAIDFLDVVMYIFDSFVMQKDVMHPGETFEWLQVFGLVCFLCGLVMKIYAYRKENSSKLKSDRLWLKENYQYLTDAKLQDEFERLYFIQGADIRAIRNIFNHPYNKNKVIGLFSNCHLNVVPNDNWFIEKGRFFNTRYYIGFILWTLFPVLITLATLLAISEYFSPGISNSGSYASYLYAVIVLVTSVGAKLLLDELGAIGQAVTLVREYQP